MTQEDRSFTAARRLVSAISIAVVSIFVLLPLVLASIWLERTVESDTLLGIAALVSVGLALSFLLGPFHMSRRFLVGFSGTNGIGAAVIIGIVAVVDVVDQGYAIAAILAFFLSAVLSLLALALPEHVYDNRVGDAFVAVALSYMTHAIFFVLVSSLVLFGGNG